MYVQSELGIGTSLTELRPGSRDLAALECQLLRTGNGRNVSYPTGLFHRDYQTNDILFSRQHALMAVVDWEIAGTRPQHLDLGWLAMMTDPARWHPDQARRLRVRLDPQTTIELYERLGGSGVKVFPWWQTFVWFRFGVIAGFNVRLHRTRKRVDPTYEAIESSVPELSRRRGYS